MSRARTWLPIVCGGVVGAWFALAGARSEPARPRGATASGTETPTAQPEHSSGRPLGGAVSAAPQQPAAVAASAASPQVPAPLAPPAEQTGAWPRAFVLTAPESEKDLLAAQVRCNRKAPEECERAALALDAGLLLTRDAERALKLRRMAVTLYVRQCESGRVLACARLAEMYSSGDQLRPNERSARALRDRVTTLCASSQKQQADCSALGVGARRDG